MKIALCATHLFNMTLPQDRDYIGVDHGIIKARNNTEVCNRRF